MSTCIAVVCDSAYQRYLPLFALFATRSYPAFGIQVFLQGKLERSTRSALATVDAPRLIVHEAHISKALQHKQALKTYRWLLEEELFDGFDNVYIGDIDLLICKEIESIEHVHSKHCQANNIPFSNCIRPGTSRLSGLHFYQRGPYYKAMLPVIRKYKTALLADKIDFSSTRNEHILYKMILESGMSMPIDENRIDIDGSGPHHGLHLGIWRKTHMPNEAVIRQIIRDRYVEHYAFFKMMPEQKLISDLSRNLPEVENMTRFFSQFNEARAT